MFPPVAEQLARIREGTAEILPEGGLEEKLSRSRSEDRPLVVKQGFDPTRPDLHIGHAVSLRRLAAFQELGHRVVFVIGDFTARVGDPSGQSETRPLLSAAEIEENLGTYRQQVALLLDPERTEFRRNSEWLGALRLEDVLRLTSQYTVARMLEREDFAARQAAGRPISLVEFLYPMMQGYDSVVLEADVEVGGTDQTFNLLLGRTLQERAGQAPQVCLTVPLLRGTDGERKMSKSWDNAVGLADDPAEQFGRTMSIPDSLLAEWIELASGAPAVARRRWVDRAEEDPLAAKRWLAGRIVEEFHGEAAAREAREAFDRVHRRGETPDEMPEERVAADPETGTLWIGYVLTRTGLAESTSEARRLLAQGGVRVDGSVVREADCHLSPGRHVVQRGKRTFARVEVVAPDGPRKEAGGPEAEGT